VDAHHAASALLGAALLVLVSVVASRRSGLIAGLVTPGLLFLHPRFLADTLYNTKDVPVVFLMTAAVLAAARGIRRRSGGFVLVAAVLAGLGVATKPNALFLPAIVGPWLLVSLFRELRTGASVPVRFAVALVLAPVVAGAAAFAVWPYLWDQTPLRVLDVADSILRIGKGRAGGWTAEPLAEAAATMPLSFLLAAVAGAVLPWPGPAIDRGTRLLLLLWLAVPLVRVAAPGMTNYDGIRHFEEFLVPAAFLGGAAAAALAAGLGRRVPRRLAGAGVVLALLVPGAVAVVRTHPYEMTYFNCLVGGLRGARERKFSTPSDYWGSSIREAMRRVRAAAAPGAGVMFPLFDAAPRATARLDLEPQARLFRIGDLERGWPEDLWVVVLLRESHFDSLAGFVTRTFPPADRIAVEGVPLLDLHRFRRGSRAALEEFVRGLRWIRDRLAERPGFAVVPYGEDLHLVSAEPWILGGRTLLPTHEFVARPRADALIAVLPGGEGLSEIESYLARELLLLGNGPGGARLLGPRGAR
jgi:hypothetical protein